MKRTRFSMAAALLLLALGACRGQPSDDTPLYVFPDMDWQPKIQGQEESPLFSDGRGNRKPVPGTVARGHLDEDEGLYEGKKDGQFLLKAPIEVSDKTLARGEERFNIYCAPCHDKSGSGQGLVIKHGYPLPINLAGDHAKGLKDGEVFDIVSNGVRNMPGYRTQIPAADRWAIVAWVRVIQRSQNAKIDDVPADKKGSIEPEMAPQ